MKIRDNDHIVVDKARGGQPFSQVGQNLDLKSVAGQNLSSSMRVTLILKLDR